ncbi:MAG: sugar phosphate nucleotidyltransferase [Candidatus Moranbacteria bacterium]|nr:sugar phosphate nucleotidyltransferase [Candidatus Moranbacteria bacterium]
MNRKRLTITLDNQLLQKIDRRVDGHKIRNRSHAIEAFLAEKLQSKILKKAIILGGGKGIEFQGKIISKLLLPVGGKTLIEKNIEILKEHGITELLLSLGGLGEQIREKLGDGSKYGIRILYFERDRGTAGILRQAKSTLDETFLMMNGDIYLENIDLLDMYDFHKDHKAKATILLTTVDDPSLFGSVLLKGDMITKFSEKPQAKSAYSHLINGGLYLFEPEVCSIVTPETVSLEGNVFPKLVNEKKLYGYFLDTKWLHLHDAKKYEEYIKNNSKKQK